MRDQKTIQTLIEPLSHNWKVNEFKIKFNPRNTGIEILEAEKAHQVFLALWDRSLIHIQEETMALYLDSQLRLVGFRKISTGNLNSASMDRMLLLACAILSRTCNVIIAHNHPSGVIEPSRADIKITNGIRKYLGEMDISLLDHLIITEKNYYSFAEHNRIISPFNP